MDRPEKVFVYNEARSLYHVVSWDGADLLPSGDEGLLQFHAKNTCCGLSLNKPVVSNQPPEGKVLCKRCNVVFKGLAIKMIRKVWYGGLKDILASSGYLLEALDSKECYFVRMEAPIELEQLAIPIRFKFKGKVYKETLFPTPENLCCASVRSVQSLEGRREINTMYIGLYKARNLFTRKIIEQIEADKQTERDAVVIPLWQSETGEGLFDG